MLPRKADPALARLDGCAIIGARRTKAASRRREFAIDGGCTRIFANART